MNVNDAPTGQPTISGSAIEGSMLSASTAGLADADGTGTSSYQWMRGGVAISGATTASYTLASCCNAAFATS